MYMKQTLKYHFFSVNILTCIKLYTFADFFKKALVSLIM